MTVPGDNRGIFVEMQVHLTAESHQPSSDEFMRLLICGDRYWTDEELIGKVIDSLSERPEVIIHGACRGADRLAGECAKERGIPVLEFPVTKEEWDRLGRAAGPIRNRKMLYEGEATDVIAFHDRIQDSTGTINMMRQSEEKGTLPVLISHKRPTIEKARLLFEGFNV